MAAWPRAVVEIVFFTLVTAAPHKAFLALTATVLLALQGARTLRITVTGCGEVKAQSDWRIGRNTLKPTGQEHILNTLKHLQEQQGTNPQLEPHSQSGRFYAQQGTLSSWTQHSLHVFTVLLLPLPQSIIIFYPISL